MEGIKRHLVVRILEYVREEFIQGAVASVSLVRSQLRKPTVELALIFLGLSAIGNGSEVAEGKNEREQALGVEGSEP